MKENNDNFLAAVEKARQRLASDEKPEDVFDWCGNFYDGFASVKMNGKYNFIDHGGKLLSDKWFDNCESFQEGVALVQLNGKWNYIDREGKYLSDTWFDDFGEFHDGFAAVRLNGKDNYINGDGELLSTTWFDWCDDFNKGFAEVKLNDKYYHLRKDGVLCGYNTKEPVSPDIDYKKKYEEALQRAMVVVNPGTTDHNIVTAIFPELKVSEDKQSKKWILEYLYDGLRKSDEQFKDQFKSAIDWFEKQSVEKPNWSEEDEKMLQQITQFLISFSEEYEVDLNDKLIWLKSIKERMKGE